MGGSGSKSEDSKKDEIEKKHPLDERWEKVEPFLASNYPKSCLIFGYGSGVIPQEGYDYGEILKEDSTKIKEDETQKSVEKTSNKDGLPLLDVIFIVDDAYEFHKENLKMNPDHYKGLAKFFGPSYLSLITEGYFPGLFFPFVELAPGIKGKYGVVPRWAFEKDLKTWRYLFIAGRLHKPVRFVKKSVEDGKEPTMDPEIAKLLQANLEKAFTASLVLNEVGNLKGYFNEEALNPEDLEKIRDPLLATILNLSYKGDLRTIMAESDTKIDQLLRGNYHKLNKLYDFGFVALQKQDTSVLQMPEYHWETIKLFNNKSWLENILRGTNKYSSFRMAVSNFLIGSPSESMLYLWAKLKKGIFKGK